MVAKIGDNGGVSGTSLDIFGTFDPFVDNSCVWLDELDTGLVGFSEGSSELNKLHVELLGLGEDRIYWGALLDDCWAG